MTTVGTLTAARYLTDRLYSPKTWSRGGWLWDCSMTMTVGLRALSAAAAAFLLTGTGAYATTVEIDGSYTLSYVSSAGNAPKLTDKLGKNKNGLRVFTEDLVVGDPATTAVNFFTAGPSAACGNTCVLDLEVTHNSRGKEIDSTYKTASGIITVAFAFSNVTVLSGDTSETGLYQAKYGGLPLSPCAIASGSGKTDCITWTAGNDPLAINFTNGYTLDITLNDAE